MSALLAEAMSSPSVQLGSHPPAAVLVYSKDTISRAGVTSQLAGWPGIVVLEPRQAGRADVAVVVADGVDDEVIRVIRTIRKGSSARVVLVLDEAEPDSLQAAVGAGALGALPRSDATGARLADLVGQAVRGEATLRVAGPSPGDVGSGHYGLPEGGEHPHTGALGANRQGETPPAGRYRLSGRDVEVLRLLAEGCDTAEIAQRLAYSEPTIKNVIQRLFEHLHVRNRPHAVAVAVRAGII